MDSVYIVLLLLRCPDTDRYYRITQSPTYDLLTKVVISALSRLLYL